MLRPVLHAAVGTDLEYEEEPPPQDEIFYTEASPKLRAARIAVRWIAVAQATHELAAAEACACNLDLQGTWLLGSCMAVSLSRGLGVSAWS